ncbi:MAG: glycosyltransferase family 39 protein [Anaerolineae bacterium]
MAALVALVLLAVYLLSFAGQFRSIDEYAMYARVESLAQGQGLATPQLAFSARHHPVGSLEPGQPLLAAPLYALGKALPGASTVAAVMLFSALVTAATGAVLYRLARTLEMGPGAAALTALAWGIGTTAWPYARSFFREPLLGLLWCLAACWCLRWQRGRGRWALAGTLAALALAALVKISSVGAAPVFLLALLWDPERRRLRLGRRGWALCALGLLLALGGASVLWQLRYGSAFPLARYTWGYPWGRAALVAYGLLLSPVKGILFFSPILLATLPGWPRLLRRQGAAAALVAGVTAALLYTYGSAAQWHGGSVVWGPRFMVPLLPLLILPYGLALGCRHPLARLWVLLWSAMGLLVQGAAGTASWSDAVWQLVPAYAQETLVGLNGIPWWSWRMWPHAPALVQVTGWAPRQLDMLWLRTLVDGRLACDRALGALLALNGLLATAALVLALRTERRTERRTAALRTAAHGAAPRERRRERRGGRMPHVERALPLLALAMALVASGALLMRSIRDSNDYAGLSREEAAALAQTVSAPAGVEHRLVYVSNDLFTYPWLGMLKGRVPVAWQSPHDVAALVATARQVATSDAERIWLVVDRVHAQADVDPAAGRFALAAEAYELESRWVGGYEAIAYAPQRGMQPLEGRARWDNGLQLEALAVSEGSPAPGDTLLVDLTLSTDRPLAAGLSLYLHLVPAEGAVLPGRDGPPRYGGAPSEGWAPGEGHLERRAIPLPAEAAPGEYRLVAGWLDAEGQPLPLEGGALEPATLATLQVVAAEE